MNLLRTLAKLIPTTTLAVVTTLGLVGFSQPVSALTSNPVTYTNANNNQTVSLAAGQSFAVDLTSTSAAQTVSTPWTNIQSSNQTVAEALATVYSTSTSTQGNKISDAYTLFDANNAGTTTITASSVSKNVCATGVSCPQILVRHTYKLTVTVTAATSCNATPSNLAPKKSAAFCPLN